MPQKRPPSKKKTDAWSKERKELISGASGGFLFGIPMLYTMEVWFIGSHVRPPVLLDILIVTYTVVFLLNRVEGFRNSGRDGVLDAAAESVEALAIGLVCAAIMLVILQQITLETSLDEGIGKIVFEGVPFALGVALSRSILSGDRWSSGNPSASNKNKQPNLWKDTLTDMSATSIGAIIIAFNIAPTDEVLLLAAAASPLWLLAIIVVSLLVSYGIVFASGFTSQQKRQQQQGLFQGPLSETIFSYLISILASALMLWFFQQLSWNDPWDLWLRYTVILGLPATIGGAAGRLAV
ncbi:TIGR02587 family membrane protein [Lusitaniella coriacea LEGE 07157]|uniref:TIGR02587 family membrane protein n=1 Tax=Lusitaniella coriacea LEGE 07157 TaxID=945747 RepID=A0A8J7DZV4_9CYAN|nr:TIGR02587 family membrane protein [Lusitaniella coriacea]MBE9118734.1 TIGR02587 family membrane protein [Lusitaniella coriacea LEGE 07157]